MNATRSSGSCGSAALRPPRLPHPHHRDDRSRPRGNRNPRPTPDPRPAQPANSHRFEPHPAPHTTAQNPRTPTPPHPEPRLPARRTTPPPTTTRHDAPFQPRRLLTLPGIEHIHPAQRTAAVRRPLQHPHHRRASASTVPTSNRSAAPVTTPRNPTGAPRSVEVPPTLHLDRTAGRIRAGHPAAANVAQRQTRPGVVLHGRITWNSGCRESRPRRSHSSTTAQTAHPECSNPQRETPHPDQHLEKTRIPRQIRTQHKV